MGLEFQSRGFVYLRHGDALESDLENFHFEWWQTGSQNQFRHFCADAKSHSYAAARQVAEQAQSLSSSTGFFSLTADFCDVGPGYDRAYLLFKGFREINARSTYDPNVAPQAIFNHFSLCFHIQYDTAGADRFLSEQNPPRYAPQHDGQLPIAGWFYNHRPVRDFESAVGNFSDRRSITVCSSGGWDDQYLFFGDTANVHSTVSSMLALSAQFNTTVGVVFLIHASSLEQLLFFNGQVYALGQIIPTELQFYSHIKFTTDRHGYVQR